MKKIHRIFSILILLTLVFTELTAKDIQLKPIELCDDKGGYAKGGTWKSNSLLGKTNVLIYTDPDKFSDLKEFVSDIEKEKMMENNFGLTFIVNTEATMIPTFAIQSKIKSKAKRSTIINYILDNDKVLVDEWKLQDNDVNILVLDSLNQIQYQQTGKVKPDQFKKIMKIINTDIKEVEK